MKTEADILKVTSRYLEPYNKGYTIEGSCCGSITYAEATYMQDFIKKHGLKNGIEIGTGTSYSTIHLAFVLDNLITVDNGAIATTIGHEYGYVRGAWNAMFLDLDIHNVRFCMALEEIDEKIKDIDFVLVDGAHTPEAPLKDCLDVVPHLADRHYIFMHDTLNPHVMDAINERVKAGYKMEMITLDEKDTYGMAVMWKHVEPVEKPIEVKNLKLRPMKRIRKEK